MLGAGVTPPIPGAESTGWGPGKFAQPHNGLKNPYPRTLAMAAGVADHVWWMMPT
jgi:hypothetical protein